MTKKINSKTCECDCFKSNEIDSSRRNFMKKATALTIIGSTSFILEACGGGGSSPTSSDSDYGDSDGGTGGGSGGGSGGGGNNGFTYDASTGTITIDITMIYQDLQNVNGVIQLTATNTFDSNGIIVLRSSNTEVRAFSRRCTHAGSMVNFDSTSNNLPCVQQGSGHGSVFDLNGAVVSGPASTSLTRYNASINSEGTIITITQN